VAAHELRAFLKSPFCACGVGGSVKPGACALSLAKFAQFTSEQNALDQGLQNLPPPPESDPTWQAVSFAVEMATEATNGKRDFSDRGKRFAASRTQDFQFEFVQA